MLTVVNLALNILALVLVVGACWVGMRWLGPFLQRRLSRGRPQRSDPGRPEPCDVCDGVGAVRKIGALRPCPACQGTGVRVPG